MIREFTFTIPNAGTDSDGLLVGPFVPVALIMPAAFTGTTVSFLVSDLLAGTYLPVHAGGGTLVSKTVAASRHVVLDPNELLGVRFLKLKSGSAEAAQRVVKVLARRYLVK